ncbi:MAG TPA: 3-hydroxyacyl-ACP dehydratase FabZ, partial [Bdellovibrionales bacterium]|nr:3-hydroxyacyl-ACP dehydratase FabZ [Bdellovibrionales bacterium]
PHRNPMLLVDKVLEIEGGESPANRAGRYIRAVKCVTMNEPFFPGHFPQKPIMPGVLIIEALAQACALLAAKPLPPDSARFDFFIVGIETARFRKPVVPGDSLELHCTILKERSRVFTFNCEAKVEGQVVTQAEIMATMIPVAKS